MNVVEALINRVSVAKLTSPAPSGEILNNICKAALRAPDHALIRPWRFLILQGDSLNRFGQLLVDIAKAEKGEALTDELAEKVRNKPLRAPMIIVAIAKISEHPKVPEIEQLLSAGCAVQNMLIAAQAQGFGGMWRTGPMAYDSRVQKGMGLSDNEQLIGFLYLGTPAAPLKSVPDLKVEDFFSEWPIS